MCRVKSSRMIVKRGEEGRDECGVGWSGVITSLLILCL
jgi:hypothetical protein